MNETKKGVGLVTCAAIVIANMVGAGVFTSLGYQVSGLPSGFVLLVLWAVGAVFALCGALCYSELAAALPRSGGEYNFLSRIYGRPFGFMAGFVSVTAGFAAPVTLGAIIFAQYLSAVFPGVSMPMASSILVVVVTAAHLATLNVSRNFQILFTGLKLLLIATLIVAGFTIGPTQPISFLPRPGDGALLCSAPFAIALMYVMYSYSGWNAATYIIGEVRRPERDVPWGLILGTSFVGLLYVLLNAVFLKTVPISSLANKPDIGNLAAIAIFGKDGGRILSAFICAGQVSMISAMTWAGPRVMQTIGEDFTALSFFARRTRAGIPARAVLLQAAIVLTLLWNATFREILLATQFALVICGLATVVGVIVLRVREPGLPRPFRCWGYPFTPLLFAAIACFTLVYSAITDWRSAAVGLGAVLAGLAIYYAGRWARGKMREA